MYIINENKCLEAPSVFATLEGIEYFRFEEDFVEAGMRCIPMIVRFKLDLAGIKLKLSEWVKFPVEDKIGLALRKTNNAFEISVYKKNLESLIFLYTSQQATQLGVPISPAWKNTELLPEILVHRAEESGFYFSTGQWRCLTDLQRFALLKLLKEGHENRNFPKVLAEFGIHTKNGRNKYVC